MFYFYLLLEMVSPIVLWLGTVPDIQEVLSSYFLHKLMKEKTTYRGRTPHILPPQISHIFFFFLVNWWGLGQVHCPPEWKQSLGNDYSVCSEIPYRYK